MIGSLTLDPEFKPETTAYTTTTTNATNTITATPTDESAEVEITVGETPVTNGTAATWSEGANNVSIKVTNGDAEKTYTVVVTKGA